jgi:prophage regulatory protein
MSQQLRRFLRLKKVTEQTGYGRTSIYEMAKQGRFPKPYQLGPRAVGWLADEVDAWIESRIRVGASK